MHPDSALIDAHIAALNDWRGAALAQLRTLIRTAAAHDEAAAKSGPKQQGRTSGARP